jgi:peptide chain release factor subunit 1
VARLDADLVRELATYRAARPAAISCYLDLDPSTVPTASELATHVTSIAGELRRHSERETQLRGDAERIASFLEHDLDRAGAHGLGLFVSGEDDRWSEVRVPRSVDEGVHVGRTFLIAPLLEFLERDRDAIVAAVGRDRGTLWRLRDGEISALEDLSRDGRGQHDQGGWSQARYQRARDEEARKHMQAVADEIADRVRPGSEALLVVACAEEQRTAFDEMLQPHVRSALVGFIELQKQDDAGALAPQAERMLDARLAGERADLLARWREELGQGSGRAAESWEDALRAAGDGRVETLLVDGRTTDAYECTECGRGYARPGSCELDGTHLEPALGGALELIVRGTLAHGGIVRLLTSAELDESPVAALLRYANHPGRVTARRAGA